MKLYGKCVTHSGFVVMLFFGFLLGGPPDVSAATFDYSPYRQFLGAYAVPGKKIGDIELTVIDYDAIQRDREKPNSLYEKILEQLANFDPQTLRNRDEGIAFWINAYNIGAIKMIMDPIR